jgi:two-component system CheB/CheR fusion protein
MAREGLRRELATALHKAVVTKGPISRPALEVKTNGHFTSVNLSILPVASNATTPPESGLFLVVLEEAASLPEPVLPAGPPASTDKDHPDLEVRARIASLTRELQAKEEYLQSANEELETSNEELTSTVEEMQSVNEELQSTNEELETSKEELQSVNEELATVNAELQNKVADLSRANNDMNNLLAGTGIGTVFVDHRLRILRFTPSSTRMINLILSDVGRPVSHIVSNLIGYDHLVADTQAVLDTLVPKEVKVQTIEGKWYTLRIQVYRTLENVIEGAVITFVDITVMVRAEEALRESEIIFRQLAGALPQLTWMCKPDGRYEYVSPQWEAFTGMTEAQLAGNRWLDQVHPEDRGRLAAALKSSEAAGEPFTVEFRLRHHSGTFHEFKTSASALRDASGHIMKWLGVSEEVIDHPPQTGEGAVQKKRNSQGKVVIDAQ